MADASGWPPDPKLFAPAAVPAITQLFNSQLELILASLPSVLEVPLEVVREARRNGHSLAGPMTLSPLAETRMISTSAGPLPLRVFATPRARGVLLHIHGGGWCLGAHDQQDLLLEYLARATGLAILSVGYRLAPEHPFPAAVEDCLAAAQWLLAHSREFSDGPHFIGGESAGAHLAVLTLLALRDGEGLRPFSGAFLTYGCFDLTLTPSARAWGPRNLVLSTPIIQRFVDWFADPAVRAGAAASPLLAKLEGLPPALFTIGTLDPLIDDSLFLASRWLAAGNPAELALYPGAIHAFNLIAHEQAPAANERIVRFLNERLAARGAAAL